MKAKKVKLNWKLNWKQFDEMARSLAINIFISELYQYNRIKNIYGIPRGGLILATILSHRLNLPIIFDKTKIKQHTLIVDDLADTGRTFRNLTRNKIRITAALIKKEDSIFTPTFCELEHIKTWVQFPWETDSSSRYDNTKI